MRNINRVRISQSIYFGLLSHNIQLKKNYSNETSNSEVNNYCFKIWIHFFESTIKVSHCERCILRKMEKNISISRLVLLPIEIYEKCANISNQKSMRLLKIKIIGSLNRVIHCIEIPYQNYSKSLTIYVFPSPHNNL